MSDVKQPVKRFSIGQLSTALWENELTDGRKVRSVTISKQYYDKKSESWKWQKITLLPQDIKYAIELLNKINEEDGGEPEESPGETPF